MINDANELTENNQAHTPALVRGPIVAQVAHRSCLTQLGPF